MRRTSGASCDSLKASAAVGTGTVGGRGAEGEDAHKVHAEFAATAQHQMAKADGEAAACSPQQGLTRLPQPLLSL